MNKERFTLRSATYLVLMQDNKILLLKRKNTGWMDGHYSLIAGHLDGEEKIAETMSREAEEEAGIIIDPKDLQVVHVMHRKSNYEYIDFFLKADTWQGEPVNKEPEKCEELRFAPVNDLPTNTVPHVVKALDYIQKQLFFSEENFN